MTRFRSITRLLLFAVLTAVVLGKPEWLKPMLLLSSPFVNLSTIIANRTLTPFAIGGFVVLLACLMRKRFACRWICPVGLACETCAKLCPNRPSPEKFPDIGKWLALATIGGAVVSVPFFLWLDPVALLSSAVGLTEPTGCIALGILIAAIALSAAFPMIWCRKLCPLGGLQDLLAESASSLKTANGKASSGARRSFLVLAIGLVGGFVFRRVISPVAKRLRPPGAIAEEKFKTLCIRCGNCVRVCPSSIIEHDTAPPGAAGILAPMVSFASNYCRQDCNRCGQGCPSGAIKPLPLEAKNRSKIGLARIDMLACRLTNEQECSICNLICPYNAIEEVFNQETYSYTLRLNRDKCNGCGQCELVCPEKAIHIQPA